MTPEITELLKKALALPAEARAALAGSLLESLDDVVDVSAEEEWNKEVARRMAELDSGQGETDSLGRSPASNLGNFKWPLSRLRFTRRRYRS
jgi:DNA-binding transcriptional regulator/RsmH inhibitor MraZ